jgi:HEAT repeat protein
VVAYLKHGERPEVRSRAAEILGELTDLPQNERTAVVHALIQAVREESEDSVRARALDALYKHGDDALELLISELADFDIEDAPSWVTAQALVDWLDADHPEFRMVAAAALGRIGGDSVVPHLVGALTDPAPRVRVRAARSCGRLGDQQFISPLADRLEDPNPLVQRAAANALASFRTPEALQHLIPIARADDRELRRVAVDALGQYGSLEPAVMLIRCLTDDVPSIQRTAILSLIQLFADAPSETADEVRQAVAAQLRTVDTTEVVPPLLDVMAESQRSRIRWRAAWLLGVVAEPDDPRIDDVYDCLVSALEDDGRTAAAAAQSLAEVGGEELERRLHIYIQDERGSEQSREHVREILDELGSPPSSEVVTNAVDYTYVRDPADYTAQNRHEDPE